MRGHRPDSDGEHGTDPGIEPGAAARGDHGPEHGTDPAGAGAARHPGHRRRRRWVARIALGAVVIVVALVSAALIAMHTPWGRGMLRAQIEQQLDATFTGGASLGAIEGSPLGDLTLHDVVINGPDGRPAISAKKLIVELGILPLLSQQARVLGLHAEDVDVDLRRDARGELEISRLTQPGPGSTWSVHLPDVAVRRAHVRFDTGSEVLNFDAIDLDGRAILPHGGPIDASVELRGTWRERAAAPIDLQLVVQSGERGLRIPSLALRAGDVALTAVHASIERAVADGAPAIGGMVIVDAGAAAVERLVPTLRLPGDVAVTVVARPVPGERWTELAIAGAIDRTPVRLTGQADLEGRQARGALTTGTLDLTQLSGGRITGTGAATVDFDARPGGPRALPIARATIRGWGAVEDIPRTEFTLALDSAGERVRAALDATGDRLRARLDAELRAVGDRLTIEDATLRATADPARATGDRAPVRGTLRIDLTARGAVRPTPSLAVKGTIDGRNLRMQDLSVSSLHVAIDAARLPSRPLGTAHVRLVDLVRQGAHLGELTVDATDRDDGKVAVSVRSRPRQNPWLIDADALVTPPASAGPKRVVVDVVRHRVRAGSGTDWTGRTGQVEIGPERIVLRDLASASAMGTLAISGSYERAGRRRGDLAARVDVRSLSLDDLPGTYRGKVDARVNVARRGAAWQGELELDGTGLAIDQRDLVFDTHAKASLRDARLAVAADVSTLRTGSARLAIDLDPPANVADPAAWKRLGRSAIRTGELTLRGIDVRRVAALAGLAGEHAGRIDGDIRISADTIGGRIEAADVVVPQLRRLDVVNRVAGPAAAAGPGAAGPDGQGSLSAVLDLSQTAPGELTPTLTVRARDVGEASLRARVELPERLFDPAAWNALGRGALHEATLRADGIAVDPAMLARFGITSELRGRVGVAVDVGEAARSVQAVVDVAGLRGAAIVQPIDVRIEAASDARGTTAGLAARAQGAPLIELTGRAPLALAQVMDHVLDPRRRNVDALLATRLDATAKLAKVEAPRLLAVFGRTEVIGGALDGTVAVSGTLAAPTVKADLVATGLKVPPGPRGKPVRTVDRLTVAGTWDGALLKLDVDGVEASGGALKLAAQIPPDRLRDGRVTLTATKFDLLPILAFLPGPAGGAAGELDANLTATGLDLRTTRLAGELHLREARIPLAPTVGTLRQAKIDAVVGEREIRLIVDGKLGGGTVALNGAVALDGAAPNGGNAKITLRKVSPIGVVQPQVSADVTATLRRDGDQWRADLVVDRGSVVVPDDRGEALKPVGAPPDMIFATGARVPREMAERAPEDPILVAKVALRSTRVESEEFRGLVRGNLELQVDGDAIAIYGGIEADRGDLDLFGHRYYVERAGVRFDGPLDPLLDVRITHDFGDVTTVTEVRGRASKPELALSSDPGTYSQDQLLGFLLGGEPGGEAGGSMADRATSAGASYVANKLGGYVRDALPIDIDVLRYEASTASSSAAITVGTWLTHSLFVAYRRHLESRPDENTGEGELEYWISRRVMLEAVAGDRGYHGLDLLWRRRY